MMLKFGRIAVVSTAVLSLAAATIPSKAEAFGYFPGGPGGYGPVGWGGGFVGGGCGCQVYVPPPPPPCCYVPPPCCVYGGGWNRGFYGGGYGGGGYGVGFGGGYGGGAYRVGGGVSAPKVVYDPDPEYSEEARKAKYQGVVVLGLVVGPDGRPRDMKVLRSLGLGLDEKAIEAVKNWRFEPSMKDGHPVRVEIAVEVEFHLY